MVGRSKINLQITVETGLNDRGQRAHGPRKNKKEWKGCAAQSWSRRRRSPAGSQAKL